MTRPRIAIVILTWNQRDLTLECLHSLRLLDYPVHRLDIILVDNGSQDGTTQAVEFNFPEVTILANQENLGFAAGNNYGIAHALASQPDYVMLLNNDTSVDSQLLNELLKVAEADMHSGVVGPKMLYYDRPNVIWCAGNRIDWRTGKSERLRAEQIDRLQSSEGPEEVDFITACCIMLRRDVIDQIGLLDPRFFIYYEETDWCMRARQAGYRIVYAPRARMWHKVSAAMGATSPATDYYMTRNVLLFVGKNSRGLMRMFYVFTVFWRNVAAVAAYTVKSRSGQRTANRNAKLLGLRDAILGRWGQMGADVESVCYPKN